MGTLIRTISDVSQIGYGVNVLETSSAAPVQGASTTVVGIVGHFPWGPENTILIVNSVGEALDVLAPAVFTQSRDAVTFPALMALLLPWPGPLRLVRIAATDAAKATLALNASAVLAQTATARYAGLAGESIQIQIAAATNGSGTARNVIVSIGTSYRAVYENVTATTFPTTDPYVTFTGSTLPDISAAAALDGGSDGTPVAADYLGTAADKGIQLFEGEDADANVLFCAGVASALCGAVNDGLEAFLRATQKFIMGVFCTKPGLSVSQVQTDVALYRLDKGVYPWPRVYQLDTLLASPVQRLVDGNAFAACAMVSVAPEVSPGGANGLKALQGILGLELAAPARATLDALSKAGISVFYMATALGGAIIRGGVTTDLDIRRTDIYRRRMTDYIAQSLAQALELYTEKPLDLAFNAAGKAQLGMVTSAEVGVVVSFLEELKEGGRIAEYSVDPYSLNTRTTASSNRFMISVAVRLFGSQSEIVLRHSIGPGENVAQVA